MIEQVDRRKIEKITASIAVTLLFFITVIAILAVANFIFKWDIFPPDIEKVLWFVVGSCVAVIFSSVLVNIMINLSILAINSDKKVLKSDKNEG